MKGLFFILFAGVCFAGKLESWKPYVDDGYVIRHFFTAGWKAPYVSSEPCGLEHKTERKPEKWSYCACTTNIEPEWEIRGDWAQALYTVRSKCDGYAPQKPYSLLISNGPGGYVLKTLPIKSEKSKDDGYRWRVTPEPSKIAEELPPLAFHTDKPNTTEEIRWGKWNAETKMCSIEEPNFWRYFSASSGNECYAATFVTRYLRINYEQEN